MGISNILVPKTVQYIRDKAPKRFSTAIISNNCYNLNTGEKFKSFVFPSDDDYAISEKELFDRIIDSFLGNDQVVLDSEIYYGRIDFSKFIVLNELFTNTQKWDLYFCESLFDGEDDIFEIRFPNSTRMEYYNLSTFNTDYRTKLLSIVKHLELVQIHLEFESLGGEHEINSRFTDIVQRAGWEPGIKMIKVLIQMIEKLQNQGKIGRENILTRFRDRIQSDERDIFYRFKLGEPEYVIVVRHVFFEGTTIASAYLNSEKAVEDIIIQGS